MANVRVGLDYMRQSYDWREAMGVAEKRATEGYAGSVEGFGFDDVA